MPNTDIPLLLETIKIEDGIIHYLSYHQNRVNSTLLDYHISETISLEKTIIPPPTDLYRCRVLYKKSIISIEYIPYQTREIKYITLIESNLEYTHKYAQRESLDKLLSLYPSSDDVLIIKDGYISDTTICNIAFFDGKQWVTPLSPLLLGTTRQRLLDEGFLIPMDITVENIKHYTHVALMNAMLGFKILNTITLSDDKGILYDY